jgi:hypothetical protein
MKSKTRVLYGYLKSTGELIHRTDAVDEALQANMMVRDWEKEFVKANPQLDVKVMVEQF